MQNQSPWWLVSECYIQTLKVFQPSLSHARISFMQKVLLTLLSISINLCVSLSPYLFHSALTMFNQLDDSMLLLATPALKTTSGVYPLKASADRHQHSNTFTAPVGGTYLLALSLDLRPGPAHLVVLRREGSGQVVSNLHQQMVAEAGPVTKTALVRLKEGEGLRVELIGRVWSESEDNLLAVLLLQQAT